MATSPAGLGGVVLHGGLGAGAFTHFHWSYAVASVAVVGAVGGLLYWYYGRQLETREH